MPSLVAKFAVLFFALAAPALAAPVADSEVAARAATAGSVCDQFNQGGHCVDINTTTGCQAVPAGFDDAISSLTVLAERKCTFWVDAHCPAAGQNFAAAGQVVNRLGGVFNDGISAFVCT